MNFTASAGFWLQNRGNVWQNGTANEFVTNMVQTLKIITSKSFIGMTATKIWFQSFKLMTELWIFIMNVQSLLKLYTYISNPLGCYLNKKFLDCNIFCRWIYMENWKNGAKNFKLLSIVENRVSNWSVNNFSKSIALFRRKWRRPLVNYTKSILTCTELTL